MGRTAIDNFVDNLILENGIGRNEENDLRDTLEASAKEIEGEHLKEFIKSVRQRIDAPASGVFSNNGINIESIKVIAEEEAIIVKDNQKKAAENQKASEEKSNPDQTRPVYDSSKEKEKEDKTTKGKWDAQTAGNYEWLNQNGNLTSTAAAEHMAQIMTEAQRKEEEYQNDLKNGMPIEEVRKKRKAYLDTKDKAQQKWYELGSMAAYEQKVDEVRRSRPEASEEEIMNAVYEHSFEVQEIYNGNIVEGENGTRFAEYDFSMLTEAGGTAYIESLGADSYYTSEGLEQTNYNPENKTTDYTPSSPIIADVSDTKDYSTLGDTRQENGEQSDNHGKEKIWIDLSRLSRKEKHILDKLQRLFEIKYECRDKVTDLEQEISQMRQQEFDIETSELANKMLELLRNKRSLRNAEHFYHSEMSKFNPEAEHEEPNTLLSDETKKKKILEMYFEGKKSAFEIYEELVKSGDIDPEGYLITQDVIEVIAAECDKHMGLSNGESSHLLIQRELQIEELMVRKRAAEQILSNLRTDESKLFRKDLRDLAEEEIARLNLAIKTQKEVGSEIVDMISTKRASEEKSVDKDGEKSSELKRQEAISVINSRKIMKNSEEKDKKTGLSIGKIDVGEIKNATKLYLSKFKDFMKRQGSNLVAQDVLEADKNLREIIEYDKGNATKMTVSEKNNNKKTTQELEGKE